MTCPCVLGLAVLMVQIAAARHLFEGGVIVKDGAAVEQPQGVDVVVFDKTGTLTENCRLNDDDPATDPAHRAPAAGIAVHSKHPQSRALAARKRSDDPPLVFDSMKDHPGLEDGQSCGQDGTVLSKDGVLLQVFRFSDGIRPGAAQAVADLRNMGLSVEVISGERQDLVRQTSRAVGIYRFEGEAMPARKLARLGELAKSGHKVLMVGDGLNDVPALAAADVSMAPADAAEIGRSAAGFVFLLHRSLEAVPHSVALSQQVRLLIRQNLAFAVAYNAVAFPFAALGYVTPPIAALAMSGSSLLVVANSVRLGRYKFRSDTAEWKRQVLHSERTVEAMS
ncbi:HAD-IC family P-type ATPase [Jiella sp. LLJ827]|nr:HAD-IC family P-type ATPase [Jiella sp. LLJ827]